MDRKRGQGREGSRTTPGPSLSSGRDSGAVGEDGEGHERWAGSGESRPEWDTVTPTPCHDDRVETPRGCPGPTARSQVQATRGRGQHGTVLLDPRAQQTTERAPTRAATQIDDSKRLRVELTGMLELRGWRKEGDPA